MKKPRTLVCKVYQLFRLCLWSIIWTHLFKDTLSSVQVKAKKLRIEKTLEIEKSDPFIHRTRIKPDKHKN
jgi:hypothetical protein